MRMRFPSSSAAPVAASATPVPTRVVAYTEYAGGCDADAEPWLELVYALHQGFDERFAPALLVRALRVLNPAVELCAVAEASGATRPDWPWLADAALNAVERYCTQQLGQAGPYAELHQVLGALDGKPAATPTTLAEPLAAYRRAPLPQVA